MNTNLKLLSTVLLTLCFSKTVLAHGDVTPQAVDISGIPAVGEEWLTENPYRSLSDSEREPIVELGASAYNQNCARCHGLEAISGGIAPDLRKLAPTAYDDEWYMERIRNGYTAQNGAVMMPPFEKVFAQEAMWAIKSYIETRPKD